MFTDSNCRFHPSAPRDILRTRLRQGADPATALVGVLPRSSPITVSSVISEIKLNSPHAVASLIDHTLLKPEATGHDIAAVCEEARHAGFASVCLNPYWVRFAAAQLIGSSVRVCTVIGFPLGANQVRTKVAEAELALSEGARELDMVQNIGALRSHSFDTVEDEIAQLATLAHSGGAILKVILETCLLTDEEKITACRLAARAHADFVKTSTGFSKSGATVADVQLMRQTVGPTIGVKASGGVRSFAALREMVAAGATRIGTSSGVNILHELETSDALSGRMPSDNTASDY
jgi:deoxyribose-phosphate aldolase